MAATPAEQRSQIGGVAREASNSLGPTPREEDTILPFSPVFKGVDYQSITVAKILDARDGDEKCDGSLQWKELIKQFNTTNLLGSKVLSVEVLFTPTRLNLYPFLLVLNLLSHT
jgi:hypothetical protein